MGRLNCINPIWITIILVVIQVVSGSPTSEESFDNMKSYSGYKLLRTEPIQREDLAKSLLVLDGMHGVHFWKYPLVNRSSDILASPAQMRYITELLDTLGLSHETVIHDVDELLLNENPPLDDEAATPSLDRAAVSPNFFRAYQRYDTIMNFAKQLARDDNRVTYQPIGRSTEGREIGLVKISSGGNKPAIWIDGGMHAREWISPATVTYIMHKLVNDPNSQSLTNMFDFYIVPIINVDGYEHTHTRDRMWRKTRSNTNGRCIGTDPNRNWGFHWAESGSSSDPCSDIYHGPRAFSEPETTSVSRAIMALRSQIKLYLTFHSYSQMWLVPWGYSKYQKPSDYQELVRMASHGKQALERTYGTQYRLGTAPDLLYPAAGGSDDWAKGVAGIKYAYCLELRDTGRYGFLLPANQIQPTGEETFNGISAMASELYRTLRKGGRPYANADKEQNSPADNQIE